MIVSSVLAPATARVRTRSVASAANIEMFVSVWANQPSVAVSSNPRRSTALRRYVKFELGEAGCGPEKLSVPPAVVLVGGVLHSTGAVVSITRTANEQLTVFVAPSVAEQF